MSKRALLILVGAAVLVLAWWAGPWGTGPGGAADGSSPVAGASGGAPGTRGASSASGASVNEPWAVTVSDAMGLTLDASRLFELGFAGGLVVDRGTRSAIEALVNTLPPEPTAQDMERLERTLRAGLPKDDADKAFKLITDYRGYTKDIQREMLPQGIPKNQEEAKAFFDQMDTVKRRHFDDATANALFGPEDGYARLTMEAMFVQQSTTLTPEQKKAQLDALRAKLPADQKSLIPEYAAEAASQPGS